MAVFIPGPVVSDVRGSIGGTIFSRNRGGAYSRSRVTPTNPQTLAQERARMAMSAAATSWAQQSSTLKNAWAAAAESYSMAQATNLVGEAIQLTGQSFFQRINMAMLNAGGSTIITTPPVNGVEGQFATGEFYEVDLNGTVWDFLWSFVPALDTNEKVQIWATPPAGSGKQRTRTNEMRFLGEADATTWTASDGAAIYTVYTGRFGVPSVGVCIGMGARVRNSVTGAFGPLFVLGVAPVVDST